MIKVINEVEINEEKGGHDKPKEIKMFVTSHPGDDQMVILVIDGKEFSVSAKDLQAAVLNATNNARH